MARFLNITPTYNPFTMDEMLKVPLLYDANFREVEKQYDELQDKAALLRLYAKDSPEIKAAIDKYDANMQSISDAIASGKYDNTMSNQARAMRETYRKDIIPMSVAAQQYENFMQSYLKDMDGTEIGEKPSIKWFMEHPGSTPEVIHGSAIQNQLAKLIGTYASTRQIDVTNPNNWTPIIGGQYLAGWSGAGYTNEEIADYLNNPTNSNYSTINNIVNNFKQNISYNKMTPEQKASADSYINTAIQIGMAGNRKYERVQNRGYKSGASSDGSDGLTWNFNKGGYLFQDGGEVNKTERKILPGDPFPNIKYGEDLAANPKQYAQWKSWMKSFMKDNGFTTMNQVSAYYNQLQTAKNTGINYIKTPSERYQEAIVQGIPKSTLDAYYSGMIQPIQPNLRGGNFQSNVINITQKGSTNRYTNYDEKTHQYKLKADYDSSSSDYLYSFKNNLGFRKEANNAQVSKIMFNDNGVLRTPQEFAQFLNANPEYNKLTYDNAHNDYKEYYNYLKSIGYNVKRNHKNIKSTSGNTLTPYMAMKSLVSSTLNSTTTPTNSLLGSYNYNLGSKAAKQIYNKIASGTNYELAGFEAYNGNISPIQGNVFKDNFDEDLNYTVQFYPVMNTYILHIEGQKSNKGGKRNYVNKNIIIPTDKIDTQLSINGANPSDAFNHAYKQIQYSEKEYKKNPSIKNELALGAAYDYLTQLENLYSESIPKFLGIVEQHNLNDKDNQ